MLGGLAAQGAQEGVVNQETVALRTGEMKSQEQWIDTMKQGCQLCHQMDDMVTRDITHLAQFKFANSQEAWASRIHVGQAGYRHHVSVTPGHVERPLREALLRYLKYDLMEW